MKWVVYLLLIVALTSIAQAATIQGEVYDFYLNKVTQGKATISTEPIQQQVITNGTYSFEVEAGEYDLIAYQLDDGNIISATKEIIHVSKDGTYNIDLILFPYFESENLLKESENLFQEQSTAQINLWPFYLLFLGSFVVITGLIYLAYSKLKKIKPIILPKEEKIDSELQKVLDFIKKHQRTTQKEIRKEFPLSEGKISLMITELEQKDLIKKIKKGRGNIIVLR